MNITYRPIDVWPGEQTKNRQWSRFDTPWNQTLELLDRELRHLGAKNVIFQIALREEDFRRTDGQPRANANAAHPRVILAFDSKFGPLKYSTDTYADFQANVRAIAVSLEALRKVDRHGVSKRGEQYTGWKALPPSTQPAMSTEGAARFLERWGDVPHEAILANPASLHGAYRNATKRLHPDAGGDTEKFQMLQEAKRVLDAHHGGARG